MTASEELYRLDKASGGLGLCCEKSGVSLAGVSLLRRRPSGYAARKAHEISALMKSAYGHEVDPVRLVSGLQVAAEALNRGDIGRAMIAAVHLRLPELNPDAAEQLAHAADTLEKYDPNEPRDRRGRWTTGGATGDSAPATPPRRRIDALGAARPAASTAEADRGQTEPSRSEQSWGGPTHLYGGRLTPIAGPGSNFPPDDEDPTEIPAEVPNYNPTQVPEGFETPGHVAGGLQYLPSRHPVLPNGEPWPKATPEHVLALLRLQLGVKPMLFVYVPRDGVGPILSGSTTDQDLPAPEGYDPVQFIGRPQSTPLGDGESRHAIESVIEGLRLAGYNEFSIIFFNSSMNTIIRHVESPYEIPVQSILRPDVAAITRPSIDRPDRVVPYEILSGRQRIEDRRAVFPNVDGIRVIDGRHYEKRLDRRSPAWFERLGVRPLCL